MARRPLSGINPTVERRAFLAGGLAALLAAGCRLESPSAPRESLRLGYFANVTHAQAVLGVERGEFAEAIAPVKLESKVFTAGPSLIEALAADEIDLGYVGPGPAIARFARSRGEAIRVIAGSAANGVVVVARKGSGIRSLADLNGKRVATPQLGNTQDISARHFIQDKSQLAAVAPAEVRSLFEREHLDAAWVPEPWGAFLMSEVGADLVLEEKDLWPNKEFTLTLVVTTPQFLAAQAALVKKMLSAHLRLTRLLRENPSAQVPPLVEAIDRLTGKRLKESVIEASLARVHFTEQPLAETLEVMNEWSVEVGYSREAAPLTGLVDRTVLDALASSTEPAQS